MGGWGRGEGGREGGWEVWWGDSLGVEGDVAVGRI